MAKIKKRRLRWKASGSAQVVGYKLYWSEGESVDYDSESVLLGNVTDVFLPDEVPDFTPASGPVTFGVAAVDELGNESDITTFMAPYQFNVPQAPEELWIDNEDDTPVAPEPEVQEQTDQPEPETSEQDDQTDPIPLFDKRGQPSDDQDARKAVTHYGESQSIANPGIYENNS